MKWYVFNESKTIYSMILDHNTTAGLTGSTVHEQYAKVVPELVALRTTSGWDSRLRTRSITHYDIYAWSSAFKTLSINFSNGVNLNSVFQYATYLDGTSGYGSAGLSQASWLYERTKSCISNGCNIEDNNVEGYWTGDGSSSSSNGSIYISSGGYYKYTYNSISVSYGVRPVIDISKAIF